jgi:hypothetical protein
MRMRRSAGTAVLLWLAVMPAQVIEFENNGLRYQTLTRSGVTIMYAHLPASAKDYAIVQVAVSNGSKVPWTIQPEDFTFHRSDGTAVKPEAARNVVGRFLEKANRSDVIRLLTTYEATLYGMSRIQSTNGFEQRRQQMLGELTSAKIKAAAAASVIAFVNVKLKAGESTDGAVFFPLKGSAKGLGAGRLTVNSAGERFEFLPEEGGRLLEP